MTQVPPEIEDEELDGDGDEADNNLKMLRRKANKADKLEKEVGEGNAAKRELAFVKAGIDTDSPLGKLFFNGYDGEITKEAIASAFAALGGTAGEPEDTGSELEPGEAASSRERQQIATGAVGDTGETPLQPVRGKDGAAARTGRSVLDNGGSREDAQGAAFGALVAAAAAGDRSVIVPTGPGE